MFPGDSPGRPLAFAAHEEIGVVFMNPRGTTRMSRTSAAPCPDCGDVPSEESVPSGAGAARPSWCCEADVRSRVDIFKTVADPRPTVTEEQLREALREAAELRARALGSNRSPLRPTGLRYR